VLHILIIALLALQRRLSFIGLIFFLLLFFSSCFFMSKMGAHHFLRVIQFVSWGFLMLALLIKIGRIGPIARNLRQPND